MLFTFLLIKRNIFDNLIFEPKPSVFVCVWCGMSCQAHALCSFLLWIYCWRLFTSSFSQQSFLAIASLRQRLRCAFMKHELWIVNYTQYAQLPIVSCSLWAVRVLLRTANLFDQCTFRPYPLVLACAVWATSCQLYALLGYHWCIPRSEPFMNCVKLYSFLCTNSFSGGFRCSFVQFKLWDVHYTPG